MALNNALDQMDLTDICRTFHPKEAKYTFFSNAKEIFSKIDHIMGYTHTKKNSTNSRKLKSYQAFSQTTRA